LCIHNDYHCALTIIIILILSRILDVTDTKFYVIVTNRLLYY